MDYWTRKGLLFSCRKKPSDIARIAGVSRQMVTRVLQGKSRSGRVERVIARATGKKLGDLFPRANCRKVTRKTAA